MESTSQTVPSEAASQHNRATEVIEEIVEEAYQKEKSGHFLRLTSVAGGAEGFPGR